MEEPEGAKILDILAHEPIIEVNNTEESKMKETL